MKKYRVSAAFIIIVMACNVLQLSASQNRRLPEGWRLPQDDVISQQELREYDEYRQNQIHNKESRHQRSPKDDYRADDEIGKKALVHLSTAPEPWTHRIVRFIASVLRK